jgi:hypothetical protein
MLLSRLWHDKRYERNVIRHCKWYEQCDCADDWHVIQGLHGSLGFDKCYQRHVTNCRRLPHMGKQEVTLSNILHDDDKTLSRGV